MRVFILACLILTASCDPEVGQRVIGGNNVNIASYPWQLSQRINDGHSCGASLISGVKAVCAAHCGGGAITSFSVLAGTSDRTVTACGTCALRPLTAFTRHPNYSGFGGYPNDIAALHWATSIPTNANINYIPMPASNAPTFAGVNCFITGWGRTNIGTSGTLPITLQGGAMTVQTNTACSNTWGSNINDGHICVTSISVAACTGDSGGPLVCQGQLAGATSWGVNDCSPTFPSVFTRISFFRTWIDSN